MRPIGADLLAALKVRGRVAGECVIIEARDGSRAGFTTLSRPQTIDLGLGGGDEVCAVSCQLSELTLTTGLEANAFEVSGPVGVPVSRAAVLGGKWRFGRVWRVKIVPGQPGFAPMLAGRVADARLESSRWVFQVRSWQDAFNQTIGRVLTPECSADFGDALCGVVRTAFPCTVTAAASPWQITVDLAGDQADDFFNLGDVEFLSGALAGTKMEVFDYAGATGDVELYCPLPETPAVGDTLNLFRGCSKLMVSDAPDLPTCVTYANGDRFRGFSEVPGSDLYLKVSPPGAAGA